MLSFDIALAGTSTTKTYAMQSWDGPKTVRSDLARGPALPRTLTVSHSPNGKGATPSSDRHLVRLDLASADAETGEKVNTSVQLVLEMPRSIATAADLKDMVTQLKNFLTDGVISQLLNSEP